MNGGKIWKDFGVTPLRRVAILPWLLGALLLISPAFALAAKDEISTDSIEPTPYIVFEAKDSGEQDASKPVADSAADSDDEPDVEEDEYQRILGNLRRRFEEPRRQEQPSALPPTRSASPIYPVPFQAPPAQSNVVEEVVAEEPAPMSASERMRELIGDYQPEDLAAEPGDTGPLPGQFLEGGADAGDYDSEDVVVVGQADQLLYEALDDVIDENYAVAIPKLERVIELKPGLGAAWESLGWCYFRSGRPAKTRELWNRMRLLDPERPLAYNLLAKLAVAENDLQSALENYNRSLDIDPEQFDVRYDMARIMRWEGSLDTSIAMLRNVLELDPNRTDVALDLARALTDNWDYAEALPLWESLRRMAPDNREFIEGEARCRLHTGDVERSYELTEMLFEQNPDNMVALRLSANIAQRSENPEYALPYLRRMLEQEDDPRLKEEIRVRLLRLLVELHKRRPARYGLREAVELAKDRIEYDQKSVDARLTLAELLLMSGEYREAEIVFGYVLAQANPYNLRARKGMFETQLAIGDFKEAYNQLVGIAEFNPHDAYLHYYIYRWKSAQGDFIGAFDALDKLERAGEAGAVPVFLYHGLTTSRYFMDALSVDLFQEQIQALKKAGFRFMKSSEIPEYFRQRSFYDRGILLDDRRLKVPPEKVVVINFDDGRRDSMKYGTRVAQEEVVVFSMHIPTGYVDMRHPFICTWEQLEKYNQTGVWDFGSHFKDAAILTAIDRDGRLGHALPNRIWRSDLDRLENMREYEQRLALESAESRRLLQQHLGGSVNFISYPFGDIGQEINTNVRQPVRKILEAVRADYEVGFIQSPFGFAVNGDDPMLYQRHEMDRFASGEDVVEHIYLNHPVYLARRERAELAALQGRRTTAMKELEGLELAGYPERLLKEIENDIIDVLAGKIKMPEEISPGEKILGLPLRNPYVGAEAEYSSDNQDRSSEKALVYGGIEILRRFSVEGLLGTGSLEQDLLAEDGSGAKRNIEVDQDDIGLRAAFRISEPNYLRAELIQREFSGGTNDYSKLMYAIEGHLRPVLALDLMLRYEDDVVPSALAVEREIESEALIGNGVYRVNDFWDITAALMSFDFTDDNTRDHYTLGSSWILNQRSGFRAGLGFSYVSADQDSQAYWSPYEMRRFFIEAGYQGSYMRKYYNLRLRLGAGRESLRPEDEAAYEQLAARAVEQNFDPGPPPSEDWETVIGVSASTRIPIGRNWTLNGEVSYSKLPNYDSFSIDGGIRYSF